jgi:hypothetical protein
MGKKGVAVVEFALILPLLIVLVFWIVDFGRLIQAHLIITNVSREGGNLASRGIKSGNDLVNMLQSSATPLDLNGLGKIFVSRIKAGTSSASPNPFIASQFSVGNLGVSSEIRNGLSGLGLSQTLYQHLTFQSLQNTSDIAEIWVVEVYYRYKPITPLPNFITGALATPGFDGKVIRSKSVF